MKIFPPQIRFLYCLNLFKQFKNAPKEIVFSLLRHLNAEKTALKFVYFKNSIYIVPQEITSCDTGTLHDLHNIHSIPEITGIGKISNIQHPTLQLYKRLIFSFHIKAKLKFDSYLAVRIYKGTTCLIT